MSNFLWDNLFKRDQKQLGVFAVLRSCPLFSELTNGDFKLVENAVHVRQYQSGEYVFRQDEVGVGMYVIAAGTVDIYIENPVAEDGEADESEAKKIVTRLKAGDFFGEHALVEEQGRRTATARTSSEATLIGFFQPDLQDICERSPSTGVKILFQLSSVLGRRLKETSTKISQLKKQIEKIKSAT